MYSAKVFSAILLFCTCTQNPLKMSLKGFVFSRIAGLQPITLPKYELLPSWVFLMGF